MCGILLRYSGKTDPVRKSVEFSEDQLQNLLESTQRVDLCHDSEIFNSLIPKIVCRGPNYSSYLAEESGISFFSSVLSLRSPFTKQPLVSERYILQFNGELYNKDIEGNDTSYILDLLNRTEDVAHVVHHLDGEFAYTIFDRQANIVSFGRDPIGKRSLVYRVQNEELIVSSVHPLLHRDEFIDCLNGVIYEYDIGTASLREIANEVHYTISDQIDQDNVHLPLRLDLLKQILIQSVKERIEAIQPFHITSEHDPLFSILFSGGLDCTVIAGISAMLSSPGTVIDLLNVGFDNPRTGLSAKEAPDRVLAIESWKQLNTTFPEIQFNLIEINVPFEEYQSKRQDIVELMFPKNTEMDLSIAIAFYFASRGFGTRSMMKKDGSIDRLGNYQSKAKVLLSGLGADELYGGYHKFINRDSTELVSELTRQINNIHERNLIRDDKVISSNGVEVRYPFLSHNVIEFSTKEIEINYKRSKFILRELAKTIGLGFVSEEPKRAIQFGAKSAKMVPNGNKKGTDFL